MAAGRVLVVENTPEYSQVLREVLGRAGHDVHCVGTAAAALEHLGAHPVDVVILDLVLPDADGHDLCRAIRDRTTAYVLVLTVRSDEVDVLLAFRLGADDYVRKPFSTRELVARIDALMRRPRGDMPGTIRRSIGHLSIDLRSRECSVVDEPVELTRIEFDLLVALSDDPRAVLTRRQLLDRVWGDGWVGDDHVVDVHIANLRRKIDLDGTRSVVRTVRGIGYGLTSP